MIFILFMVRNTFAKVSEDWFFSTQILLSPRFDIFFIDWGLAFVIFLPVPRHLEKTRYNTWFSKKVNPFQLKKHLFLDEMRYRKQVLRVCTSQQINCVEFINQQNKLKYIPSGSKWNWRRIRRVAVRVWDASPSRRSSQTFRDTRLVGVNGALE